jgi:hypothetical protein
MKLSSVTTWISIALVTASLAGCKQGLGERCQVDSDCSDGLSCSQADPKTCGGDNHEQEDADIPEQNPPDAQPDAAPDATPDAGIDAPADAP